jgi:ubiquinone/menaquinone biosynthesis C-methylase UbiE
MRDCLLEHPEFGWVACSSEHTPFLAGCSMMTQEAYKKVGDWDDRYLSGGGFSDDDYLRRMWKAGFKPHVANGAQIKHNTAESGTRLTVGQAEKLERFKLSQDVFRAQWHEEGTDWAALPKFTPPPDLHRIEWIKGKLRKEDSILECGCAENPVFQNSPFKVTTLDQSRRPEENCLPDVVGEAENLPFPDKSFDVVCLGELLEHVPDPQVVLREAARVARKKVIVTCPDEFGWSEDLKPFWNPGHVRFYNQDTFKAELDKLGLPYRMESIRFEHWRHFGAEIFKSKIDMDYPSELRSFFESDRYWHGDWGYREEYQDFPVHGPIVELIMSRHPKSVLDVGCAYGFLVKRLRDKGIEAYGVDISQYAIDHAPQEVKPYLKVASAHDLPFPDKSIDLIYCASVLEHIPEEFLDKVIAEFQRVAKRAILGIAYKDPWSRLDIHSDISHVTIHDEIWWRQKLPANFEMLDVCVEDSKTYRRGMMKLNLGCFGDYYPSWINYDILPLRNQIPPHIRFQQWDLRKGLPMHANDSVDVIRMSHLIEHLTLEESHNLLREIHRVLKPGGLVRISTPDLDIILKHYRNRDMSFFNQIQPPAFIQAPTEGEKISRILYSGDYSHRACYNYEMLESFLRQAGFSKVFRSVVGFSHTEAIQAETTDTHPEISLIVEAVK